MVFVVVNAQCTAVFNFTGAALSISRTDGSMEVSNYYHLPPPYYYYYYYFCYYYYCPPTIPFKEVLYREMSTCFVDDKRF